MLGIGPPGLHEGDSARSVRDAPLPSSGATVLAEARAVYVALHQRE